MLEFEGRQIPNELREIVDRKRTVLLVWDMQNDQAGGSFNKDALIRNAPPLIAAAAQAGIKPSTRARRHFYGKMKRRFGFAVG
jgi:isochorismate hydrolase